MDLSPDALNRWLTHHLVLYKLIIMNKLTQAEIDELAKDSDEEQEPQYSQDF